jgi:hypothetical protein
MTHPHTLSIIVPIGTIVEGKAASDTAKVERQG